MFNYSDVIEDHLIERLLKSNDEHIPIIITSGDCACEDLEKYVKDLGGIIRHRLHIINAIAAYIPPTNVKSLSNESFVSKVHLDDIVMKLMDKASITVAADFANEYGFTGKGVGVAIIDTGVYPHRDLTTPSNRIVKFVDFINKKTSPYDDDGHGTHVAGIVAGNGFSSNGKYMGIAPDANIVAIKVLDENGGGNVSDVIAGIQWAIENKSRYNIKILTLSLGIKAKSSYKDDPLCKAVAQASKRGITVVVAAGNSGPDASTISSPGISPDVISVGACNDREVSNPKDCPVADFSSRGPTIDNINKPDILAPGVNIKSLNNKNNDYASLSGTSMAAPIVAGCAALLYEENPNFTHDKIKERIKEASTDLGSDTNTQGAGLLDLKKLINGSKVPKEGRDNKNHETTNSSPGYNNFLLIAIIVLLILRM